jgi:hypothetical protein
MIEHHEHSRSAGRLAGEQLVQRNVWERRRDRDDPLVRFERQLIEEDALLEAHRNVALLGLGQQRTQRDVFRAMRGNVNGAQVFARGERLVDGVNAVNEIVEVESSVV